jgi:hypothetical protein
VIGDRAMRMRNRPPEGYAHARPGRRLARVDRAAVRLRVWAVRRARARAQGGAARRSSTPRCGGPGVAARGAPPDRARLDARRDGEPTCAASTTGWARGSRGLERFEALVARHGLLEER